MSESNRPWGCYVELTGGDHAGHKVKKISVQPKKRLSLQSHQHRSEHWTIVKGTAKVQLDDNFHTLKENDYIFIKAGALHRIENIGDDLLEFIEVQVGDYLGEDDIKRYQDDFGRV